MEPIEADNIGIEDDKEDEGGLYPNTKILFVDDLEFIRSVMKKFLYLFDYKRIFFAANGQNALQMIQKAIKENKPFDMVITDDVMGGPEDGGLTLCEAIDNLEEFERPIVVVSPGAMNEEIVDSFKKMGVSHFLPKPFEIKKVKDFLGKVLKKHFEKKES